MSAVDPAGAAAEQAAARTARLGQDWSPGQDWAPGADGMPYRRAARALVVAGVPGAEQVLMVRGHDVHQVERSWWFTPGGGIEAGEEPLAAAVREVAEESGIVLDPGAVVGPVARRSAVFDFLARRCRQDELFFYARLAAEPEQVGGLARAGWTEVERATLDELRWFPLDELAALAAAGSEVYPARLVEVLPPLVAQGWQGHTLDLGREGLPDVP